MFETFIINAYQHVVHWKKKFIKLPSDMHGKRFVTELTKLINDWNLDGSLKSFSIKAAKVLLPVTSAETIEKFKKRVSMLLLLKGT